MIRTRFKRVPGQITGSEEPNPNPTTETHSDHTQTHIHMHTCNCDNCVFFCTPLAVLLLLC